MSSELIYASKWNHMWTAVSKFWENLSGIHVSFAWLFPGTYITLTVVHILRETVRRRTTEEEACIYWRCTTWGRLLDISYSLSDVNLHNQPVMLVLLSPFDTWNWGSDRWWNVPKATQLAGGGAGVQRHSPALSPASHRPHSCRGNRLRVNSSQCFTSLFAEVSIILFFY